VTSGKWLFKKFYFKNFVFYSYFKKRWVKVQKKSQLSNSRGLEITAAKQYTDGTDQTTPRVRFCSGSLLILCFLPPVQKTSKHAMRPGKEKSLTNGYKK